MSILNYKRQNNDSDLVEWKRQHCKLHVICDEDGLCHHKDDFTRIPCDNPNCTGCPYEYWC